MTTHPSQFASSLNQIGVPYKIALFSQPDSLRYIPDLQGRILLPSRCLQEARGMELSKKASLCNESKVICALLLPLIFSSLERIDTIEDRYGASSFWEKRKRTWYSYQALKKGDYLTFVLGNLVFSS